MKEDYFISKDLFKGDNYAVNKVLEKLMQDTLLPEDAVKAASTLVFIFLNAKMTNDKTTHEFHKVTTTLANSVIHGYQIEHFIMPSVREVILAYSKIIENISSGLDSYVYYKKVTKDDKSYTKIVVMDTPFDDAYQPSEGSDDANNKSEQ